MKYFLGSLGFLGAESVFKVFILRFSLGSLGFLGYEKSKNIGQKE